ncbi:MAG: OmpA family protein [Candidatus Omnitrophica bacterium]|nr:OmpA family protein [Candidatus Omnitrophota bacterium]MBD3269441.1 OmpA family protein [Candidatus Omnitrophota bacterium]
MKVTNIIFIAILSFSLSGCATFRKAEKAEYLENELTLTRKKLEECQNKSRDKIDTLLEAKKKLEEKLVSELKDYKAKLEMTERGLVVTFLAEVFFDSGKAELHQDSEETLRDVGEIFREDIPESYHMRIEGHTDNEPIKYSPWKSNWELASARALAVLHFFIDECGIAPGRISAESYGEHHPVVDNSTPEGKRENRRVEIIIYPSQKIKEKALTEQNL